MNRKIIVQKLLKEGFTEKTLSNLSDKELMTLSNTLLKEASGSVVMKKTTTPPSEVKKYTDAGFNVELREKKDSNVCPVCGMKNCKCDDKKHKDIKKEKKSNVVNVSEIEEWVLDLTESKYSEFTSKKDIMSVINEKMETYQPMPASKPKKGHNDVPEFMSYDAIVGTQPSPSKPDVDTPVKPKTPEKPSKPRTPYQPGPGTNPKPKALAEKKKK